MKRMKPETTTAWAWEMKDLAGRWRLCKWAKPFKATLYEEEKPSPEARKVCIRLIRNKDYRAGKRAKGKGKA